MLVAMKLSLSTATRNIIYIYTYIYKYIPLAIEVGVNAQSAQPLMHSWLKFETLPNVIQFIESFLSLSALHQSINQLVRVLNVPHMLPVPALMLPPSLCGCCCCAFAILLASLLALFSLYVVMVVLALGVIATYLLLLLLLVLPQLPELSSRLTFARICKSNEIIYFVCAYICTSGGKERQRESERERVPLLTKYDSLCARRIINKQYSSMFLAMQTSCHTAACSSSCCCCCCHCAKDAGKFKCSAN